MKTAARINRFFLIFLLTAAYSAVSQDLAISGRVMDTLGRGLAGATVQLLVLQNLSTTSGQDGSYHLGTSGAAPLNTVQKSSTPTFFNGRISFGLEHKTKVALSVFDIQGKVITASNNTLPVGSYDMTISGIDVASGFHLIKLVIGEQQYSFKQNPVVHKNRRDEFNGHSDNLKVQLSKKSATIDTLQVTLTGYATSKTPITSPTGTYDVILKAVAMAPTITAQPKDVSIRVGRTATFTVTATGTNPQYQWQKNGVNITGATNSSYTTPASLHSDSGKTFRCIVSNVKGSVTSNSALLTITPSLTELGLVITNEFPGWTESVWGYATFNDATSLQSIIDGGYSVYLDQGMIEGFRQRLDGGTTSSPKTHEAYVMDFGTTDKAQTMFEVRKSEATSPDSFPGYATTVAFYTQFLGGIRVVTHFQELYFEVSVAGYDDVPTALEVARLFVDFYRQKSQ